MSTTDEVQNQMKSETSDIHKMDYTQQEERSKPRMYLLKNVIPPVFDPQSLLAMKYEHSVYEMNANILEHKRIAASFDLMPKNEREKNKMAMKTRREYDMEYRMRENRRNKLAMRLKRSNNYDYRVRENERNKIAMQMRRKMERDKAEEAAQSLPVDVEIKVSNEN